MSNRRIHPLKKPLSVRQIKLLIKKYHPDQCQDVLLQEKYAEITVKLIQLLKESEQKANHLDDKNSGNSIPLNSEERDSELYQRGIRAFKRIHPSRFYRNTLDGRQVLLSRQDQEAVLIEIQKAIQESLGCFEALLQNFPDSLWSFDSREKIHLIKKLEKRYQSFTFSGEVKTVDLRTFMKTNGIEFL